MNIPRFIKTKTKTKKNHEYNENHYIAGVDKQKKRELLSTNSSVYPIHHCRKLHCLPRAQISSLPPLII